MSQELKQFEDWADDRCLAGHERNTALAAWKAGAAWNKRAQPAGEAAPVAWVDEKSEALVFGGWDKQPFSKAYKPVFYAASQSASISNDDLYRILDCYGIDRADSDKIAQDLRSAASPAAANQAGMWKPIKTAPKSKQMYVVIGVWPEYPRYVTDPYCVWWDAKEGFVRWPHERQPTHWMPLSAAPHTESHALGGGDEQS